MREKREYMKQFAFFLPQFHRIPENDKWWGEGFTEWSNVKKATPLYRNHKQPKIPLGNKYYDLLSRETVEWQTFLANEYGIDGFIYYHYYFEGKKLLEKPAENLLSWKDIPQKFFFCWANHTWYRSWEGKKTILMEQKYGDELSWEEHFLYLLPFFRDDRYEKIGNKPLFMIYDPMFPEKNEMMSFFDKRCKDEGFEGICVIESCSSLDNEEEIRSNKCKETQFIFYREPAVSIIEERKHSHKTPEVFVKAIKVFLVHRGVKACVSRMNGNRLYNQMMKYTKKVGKEIIPGAFFEWDNTPRHSLRGFIIDPPSKRNFFKYLSSLSAEYIFYNAWNEWAEGMILEPTVENGYKYLEWIREWSEQYEQI